MTFSPDKAGWLLGEQPWSLSPLGSSMGLGFDKSKQAPCFPHLMVRCLCGRGWEFLWPLLFLTLKEKCSRVKTDNSGFELLKVGVLVFQLWGWRGLWAPFEWQSFGGYSSFRCECCPPAGKWLVPGRAPLRASVITGRPQSSRLK